MNKFLKPDRFEVDSATIQNSSSQWIHWKKTFINFLDESQNDQEIKTPISDAVKLKLLVNYISPNIFEYISQCNDYESAIKTLDKIFIKPKSEIFARYKLAVRKQQLNETIDQYIQSLKLLSKDCCFKDVSADQNEKDFIRDAFISGLLSQTIRQRLLENITLSLDDAHNQARTLESAQIQSESFTSQSTNYPSTAATNNSQKQTSDTKSQTNCYYCGNLRHPRRFCPASNATCIKCGKQGHFAKVCRKILSNATSEQPIINECSSLILASSGINKCTISIYINDMSVKALIDTGSTASFIDESIVRKYNIPTKPWRQNVTMASSSLSAEINKVCTATLDINGHKINNALFRIMKNLCTDVIIGHDILKQYSILEIKFGGSMPPLKLCALYEANIDPINIFPHITSDCKPITIKSRRQTPENQSFIETEINKLIKDEIIEESTSPWRAQVLVTTNNNHKKRLCIDYSQTINKYTHLDAYPLPNLEEVVAKVSNYKIYSKIDLKSAYHQIPIISENKPYTAFEACGNLYQFRRIPFGVTNGVVCFQRAIDSIIRKSNLEGIYTYLDDITICGKDQKDHDDKLQKFLEIAQKYQLTINKQKSEFSLKEINILGYLICNGIVKPDPERLRPLLDLEVPKDSNSLKRAIGLFSHYSKWVPDFSQKLHPLLVIEKFPMNNLQITTFQELKQLISKSSLSTIHPNEPLTVETDASDYSIAATLTQNERPVAFFSRSLSNCEKKYPTIEKEACAIIESLKKWRHYLLGRRFYLITDQKSVSYMLQSHASKIKNEKIQRWRLELANFNFDIKYRPGVENIVADALSRQICASTNNDRLRDLHQLLCHPGITRLTHWVRCKNLPYSTDDIKRVISTCPTCAEIKPKFIRNVGTLIKATVPLERLALDFKGPLPSSTNNKYLLTIIDEYSRFPFAYPCPDVSTQSVIKCLTELFSIFGMPSMIHTDQGASFMSNELKNFLHTKGISTSRSAPYNPKGNGQVERLNGTLWQTIRLALKSQNLPISMWESVLFQALHSIRSLLCTSTNMTPHERMFNHSRRSSWGQSMPSWLQTGKVLFKKHNRNSKYDPLVEEVQLLEPGPQYSHIRRSDGQELAVSNRHLAPMGGEGYNDNIINDICPTQEGQQQGQAVHLTTEQVDQPQAIDESSLNEIMEPSIEQLPRRSERVKNAPSYLKDYEVSY